MGYVSWLAEPIVFFVHLSHLHMTFIAKTTFNFNILLFRNRNSKAGHEIADLTPGLQWTVSKSGVISWEIPGFDHTKSGQSSFILFGYMVLCRARKEIQKSNFRNKWKIKCKITGSNYPCVGVTFAVFKLSTTSVTTRNFVKHKNILISISGR